MIALANCRRFVILLHEGPLLKGENPHLRTECARLGWRCAGRASLQVSLFWSIKEESVVKLRLREHESINDAVKRFRKLVEHAGIKKEMRRREYYEKPSDQRRRTRRRAERRARIARLNGM